MPLGTIHWRQKTANLASLLCTIGGEKDPMPFTKVVEQCMIYNFGVETLDHFCWKKIEKNLINGGQSELFLP
jgi:hypothetical protein